MLKKRIIPCLDVKNGRTVKGVNFENLRDAGDAVELAAKYSEMGADELVFLDITATFEQRKTLVQLVEKVAKAINIPFTVGGGISSLNQVSELLLSGADKVSINSAAVKNPSLLSEVANSFGNQCVVLAVDANFVDNDWFVYVRGGRDKTDIRLKDWILKAEDLGAGEILLTSMMHDGTKQGFALDLLAEVSELTNLPVIASGGAGNAQHFLDLFSKTNIGAALAAGIFHYGELSIPDLKNFLKTHNIAVR